MPYPQLEFRVLSLATSFTFSLANAFKISSRRECLGGPNPLKNTSQAPTDNDLMLFLMFFLEFWRFLELERDLDWWGGNSVDTLQTLLLYTCPFPNWGDLVDCQLPCKTFRRNLGAPEVVDSVLIDYEGMDPLSSPRGNWSLMDNPNWTFAFCSSGGKGNPVTSLYNLLCGVALVCWRRGMKDVCFNDDSEQIGILGGPQLGGLSTTSSSTLLLEKSMAADIAFVAEHIT